MGVAARVTVVLTVPILLGASVTHHVLRSSTGESVRMALATPIPQPTRVEPVPDTRSAEQPPVADPADIDLYGNEVTDAVATYKLDAAGSLYEQHSPQTELPRLASPKS